MSIAKRQSVTIFVKVFNIILSAITVHCPNRLFKRVAGTLVEQPERLDGGDRRLLFERTSLPNADPVSLFKKITLNYCRLTP